MRTPLLSSAAIVLFGLALARAESGSPIIFVNSQAVGVNDGSSWADAFIDLQDALQLARTMPVEPVQIWMAGGSYKPDRGSGDRYATYELCSGVQLYGGFAGWESCIDQRVLDAIPTVIDGDLMGDDDPEAVATSGCCRVARFSTEGCEDPVCESIVVGIFPHCAEEWENPCPSIARSFCDEICRPTRSDNTCTLLTVRNLEGPVTLDGLTVVSGEGAYLLVPECSGPSGLSAMNADVTVRNCIFRNHGELALGAQYSTLMLDRSRFEGTIDPLFGGVGAGVFTSSSTITGCEFARNDGGGLIVGDNTLIKNSVFRENGGALAVNSSFPEPHLTQITDVDIVANERGLNPGPGCYIEVANSRITQNSLKGIHSWGVLWLFNVILSGNGATGSGAMEVGMGDIVDVINCVAHNNQGGTSGAMSSNGLLRLNNSILWNNEGFDLNWGEDSNIQVDYSCVEDPFGPLDGDGNVDLDPQFVDPDGPDDILGTTDDNLRLSPGSPLINLGDPDPDLYPYLDADGHNRILRGRIDIGAYEYGIGDINNDDEFTLADIRYFWACMYGPDSPANLGECIAFDFHAQPDDRIDLLDFAGVQTAFAAGP